jgi:hypothetical protein
LVLPVAVTALLAGTVALADDNDPRAIEQRLTALESKPEHKPLIAEPAASVRKTLERVKNAHAVGDVPFALELGALAKDYTDVAADVIRATELEQELAKVQAQLTEVEQKRRRTETLIEETVAHRERTKQELLRLQAAKARTVPVAPATPETTKAKTAPVKSTSTETTKAKTAPVKSTSTETTKGAQ